MAITLTIKYDSKQQRRLGRPIILGDPSINRAGRKNFEFNSNVQEWLDTNDVVITSRYHYIKEIRANGFDMLIPHMDFTFDKSSHAMLFKLTWL